MSSDIEISVVIAAYNARETIGATLDTVLAQTVQPMEVIVVDDGSTDGTEEFLRANYRCVRCLRSNRSGPSGARNMGVRNAKGTWIAFVDADDLWDPHKLAEQRDFIYQNDNTVMVASDWINRTSTGDAQQNDLPDPLTMNAIIALLKGHTVFLLSSVVIRREAFLALGGFNEQIICGEDREFWARVAVRHPIGLVRKPLVTKVEYATSLSSNPEKLIADGLIVNRSLMTLLNDAPEPMQAGEKRLADSLLYENGATLYAEQARPSAAFKTLMLATLLCPLCNPKRRLLIAIKAMRVYFKKTARR